MKRVLIAGSTGKTGRLLAESLLQQGEFVRLIVRSPDRLPEYVRRHERASICEAALLDLSPGELQQAVEGCHAVVSCLGHNLTFKGVYGKPRRLVTDATRRLCEAIQAQRPEAPVKFILMNTTGYRNRDLDEPVTVSERIVVQLLRWLVPPHPDNESAAEFLRTAIGQSNPYVEWVAVRPDSLVDDENVSEYEIHPSPIRNPIFDSGKTSWINVADFMARLVRHEKIWSQWKGRMPVVYNQQS